ncbi:MAG: type II toxin-antitoxin system RelE/ParE family toxin [Verrucomicrobia bacterium]|nr:type II toxin-antitoxin system RelE/ParE family toxin [Verrucomicrobiota bacterium]
MIKKFANKGLEKFYQKGSKAGIQPAHAKKLALLLDRLESAVKPQDMSFPGSDFHPLKGKFEGCYSVHVNGNWVVIFRFKEGDVYDVDYLDYH